MPEPLEHVLDWSQELAAARTYHTEHGPNGTMLTVPDPLTYTTLDAWARRTLRDPTPDEISALFQLDFIQRNPRNPDLNATDDDDA